MFVAPGLLQGAALKDEASGVTNGVVPVTAANKK
jgi:hypothetical protein